MKKKIILFAAGAVLLAASAFTFASVNKSDDPMDDLFKANIEALTRNEYDYPDAYPYSFKCKVHLGGIRWCQSTVVTCQGGGAGCNERPCPIHR